MMEIGAGSVDTCRRAIQLPWEPLNPFRDRDGAFGTDASRAALQRQPRRLGASSRVAAERNGGLTRKGTVYEYVRAHPGTHVRGIANGLGFATGDIQYHLFWLERHGYVETKKNGFYRFVFPSKMFLERQEILLGVLSLATPREILLSLLRDPGLSQGNLARGLGCSQPTVSWHMERLIRLGVVSKSTRGGVAYDVVADKGDVLRFVKEYHPAAWRRWESRLQAAILSGGNEDIEGGRIPRAELVRPTLVALIGHS